MTASAEVAARIRTERRGRDLSVAKLAGLTGISVASLTNIERPANTLHPGRAVTVDDVFAIAEALAISPSRLLGLEVELPLDRSVSTCPKCGHANVVTRYQAAGNGCRSSDHYKHAPHGERFERTCQGCKYAWHTEDVLTPEDVP